MMLELVRTIILHSMADQFLREHRPDSAGHCPTCRSVGCTLFTAAQLAKRTQPSS